MRYLDRRMGAAEALHNLIMHEAQYLVIIVMDYRLSVIKFSLSQWAWNAALTPWLWLSTPRSPSLAVCTASQLVRIFFSIFFLIRNIFQAKIARLGGTPGRRRSSRLTSTMLHKPGRKLQRDIPSRSFLHKIFSIPTIPPSTIFLLPWSWWQLEWVIINCLKRNVGSGAH